MAESSTLQMILDKIEMMDSTMKERSEAQDKYWESRLTHIESVSNKAHSRLDSHKDEITSLCDWKNQMKSPQEIDEIFEWRNKISGAFWVIPLVLTPFTALLTVWLLNFFKILGA